MLLPLACLKSFTKIAWVCVALLGLKAWPQAGQGKMKISVHLWSPWVSYLFLLCCRWEYCWRPSHDMHFNWDLVSIPLLGVVDLEVDYRGQLPVTILTVQTLIREGNRSLTLLCMYSVSRHCELWPWPNSIFGWYPWEENLRWGTIFKQVWPCSFCCRV